MALTGRALSLAIAASAAFIAAPTAHAQGTAGGGSPHAPQEVCGITMQYWCIVADGETTLDMRERDDVRIWTMTPAGAEHPLVTIREARVCDSPEEAPPVRRREREVRQASGETWHAVDLTLGADGSCTISVAFPRGTDERATEARQMATYHLLSCLHGRCREPLLTLGMTQPWGRP